MSENDAVQAVVRMPELVVQILSYLNRGELTSVARVCRLWSSVALDRIWEKLPKLNYLVGAYSPLTQLGITVNHGIRVYGFKDISSGGRWDVFCAYATRVRDLQACDGLYVLDIISHLGNHLSISSFGEVLLPNLRSLSLRVATDQPHLVEVLPIIPKGLQVLEVFVDRSVSWSTIARLFTHLVDIPLKNLSALTFSLRPRDGSDHNLAQHITRLLQRSHGTLKKLDLAIFPLTAEEIEGLGSFDHVSRLVLVQKGTALKEVEALFKVIGKHFPGLREIDVALDGAIAAEIEVGIILGLESCHDLRSIHLTCWGLKALTEGDAYELGRRWPSVEELWLDSSDSIATPRGAPLEVLHSLARYWSKSLRKLFISVDSAAPLPELSDIRFKFEKLDLLYVGYSDLAEGRVDNVAAFLAAIRCSENPLRIVYYNDDEWVVEHGWDLVRDRVNAKFPGL